MCKSDILYLAMKHDWIDSIHALTHVEIDCLYIMQLHVLLVLTTV
jgi:hypothetical protein